MGHIFVSISESKQNSFKEYQQNFINDTKVLSHWTTHLYQYSVPFIALGIDITASSLESTSKAIERALQYHVITNVIKFNYDNKKKVQIEYVSKYPFRLLNARLSAPKVKAYKKWKDDDQKANNRKDALASPFTGLRSKERVLKTIDEALAMNNNRYGSFIATKKNIKAKKNTFKTISASPSRSTSKSKSPDINNNKTAETKEDDMEYWPATEMWSTRLKFAKLAELEIKKKFDDIQTVKYEEQIKKEKMENEYYETIKRSKQIQVEIIEKKNYELSILKKMSAENDVVVHKTLMSD